MLKELELKDLTNRRKARMVMFYTIVNDLVAVKANDYLTPRSPHTCSRNTFKYRQIQPPTPDFQKSLFPRTIPQWNTLSPQQMLKAQSLLCLNWTKLYMPSSTTDMFLRKGVLCYINTATDSIYTKSGPASQFTTAPAATKWGANQESTRSPWDAIIIN